MEHGLGDPGLAFNWGLYHYVRLTFPWNERLMAMPGFDPDAAAREGGLEFLAGYVIEKSLAVDNIFVFVVVFSFFGVPRMCQRHATPLLAITGSLVAGSIVASLVADRRAREAEAEGT